MGDSAAVYIKSILPQKMKIKLIIVDSFRERLPLTEPEYFITDGHLERFVYSPPDSDKLIYTDFTVG